MTKLVPKIQTFTGIPHGSIQEFLTRIYKKELHYVLPAAQAHTLSTKQGNIINLAADTFSDRNRQAIKENVHLQLRECRSRKDLLFSDYGMGANRFLIDVHRLIDIQLKAPMGTGIRLNKPYQIEIPLTNVFKPHQLQIFEQGPSSIIGLHQINSLEWKPSQKPLLIRKGANGERYGKIELDRLQPILIGKGVKLKRKATKKAMFSLKIQANIDQLNDLKAYLLFDKLNTVVELNRHRNRFSAFNLPRGHRVNLLILGFDDKRFFFHKSQIPALNNQVLSVQLKALPYLKFVQRLQNMIC
ncbi:MAG: hypothetical protein AAF242_11560 [Bacteroidota bacterium]